MKVTCSLCVTVERTMFQVCAHVLSRLLGCDISDELDRLNQMPKSRSYFEAFCVLAVLFALAFVGASFGVWGLFVYLATMFLVFK